MKKTLLVVLTTILISSLLSACGSVKAPESKPMEFTDGLGRTIALSTVPQKIISLAASNTEILYAIGAGNQVVGRDEFSDYPVEVSTITSVGGSMGKFNLEQITALQPDLILAAEINTPEQVKALEDLNLKIYYLSNPKDIDGLYKNLETVGALTGHSQEAASLIESLKTRVEKALASIDPAKHKTIFYELDGTDPAKPWTAGKGSYIDTFIQMTGAVNIASTAGEGWMQMSQEAIIAANPDIILLGDAAYGTSLESVSQRAGWADIKAVLDHQVIAFDDNLVSRPGPRLVDGLEQLVNILNK